MSKHKKLLLRLASRPKDFTWPELIALMGGLGLELVTGAGSARKFLNPTTGKSFNIHQPHPSNILKRYQVSGAFEFLMEEGFLK